MLNMELKRKVDALLDPNRPGRRRFEHLSERKEEVQTLHSQLSSQNRTSRSPYRPEKSHQRGEGREKDEDETAFLSKLDRWLSILGQLRSSIDESKMAEVELREGLSSLSREAYTPVFSSLFSDVSHKTDRVVRELSEMLLTLSEREGSMRKEYQRQLCSFQGKMQASRESLVELGREEERRRRAFERKQQAREIALLQERHRHELEEAGQQIELLKAQVEAMEEEGESRDRQWGSLVEDVKGLWAEDVERRESTFQARLEELRASFREEKARLLSEAQKMELDLKEKHGKAWREREERERVDRLRHEEQLSQARAEMRRWKEGFEQTKEAELTSYESHSKGELRELEQRLASEREQREAEKTRLEDGFALRLSALREDLEARTDSRIALLSREHEEEKSRLKRHYFEKLQAALQDQFDRLSSLSANPTTRTTPFLPTRRNLEEEEEQQKVSFHDDISSFLMKDEEEEEEEEDIAEEDSLGEEDQVRKARPRWGNTFLESLS